LLEAHPLTPITGDHLLFESAVAPAGPPEFDAELTLAVGECRKVLPFGMKEPTDPHHA